jgi:predicted DNA-binding protein
MGMKGVRTVALKQVTDKLSIYIPQSKMAQKPVERLIELSKRKDRSVNYLVVEAILEYLERQEKQR